MSRNRPQSRARHRVPEKLFALRDQFVTVAGEVESVVVEEEKDARKIDHVWLRVCAGEFGKLQISLSTMSRQSLAAGFDPRVRVAVVPSAWTNLPPAGVRLSAAQDYAAVEPTNFVVYERGAIEALLLANSRRAIYVEAWGEFYIRAHLGIHQVHSRRASFAVPRDVIGRDGALRFFYREKIAEMLLFKFAGQP